MTDLSWEPISTCQLTCSWVGIRPGYLHNGWLRAQTVSGYPLYETIRPEAIPPTGMYMSSEDSETYAQLAVPIREHVYLIQ
jgi:hypothetical protein